MSIGSTRPWRRWPFVVLACLAGAAALVDWRTTVPIGNARVVAQDTDEEARPEVECRRAAGAIRIDGRADERAWKSAQSIESFSTHWLEEPARTPTKARLLWDDEALYFHAEMEDSDLYADITQHDGMCWLNDVFELFFKPSDERAYYELQVNAAGTKLDMHLPSRGAGGYERFKAEGTFLWETAVTLKGTLADWRDEDRGWSVEGRIPWDDFQPTGGRPAAEDGWRFALCRYDYSVALENPNLTSTAPLTRPDFHRYEDYGVLRFVDGR
jgi:hypothetical protein